MKKAYVLHRLPPSLAKQPDLNVWGAARMVVQRSVVYASAGYYVILPKEYRDDPVLLYLIDTKIVKESQILFDLPPGATANQLMLYSHEPDSLRDLGEQYPGFPMVQSKGLVSKRVLYPSLNPFRSHTLYRPSGVKTPTGFYAKTRIGLYLGYYLHWMRHKEKPVLVDVESAGGAGISVKPPHPFSYKLSQGGVGIVKYIPATPNKYGKPHSVSIQFRDGVVTGGTIEFTDRCNSWEGNIGHPLDHPLIAHCADQAQIMLNCMLEDEKVQGSFDFRDGQVLIDVNCPRPSGPEHGLVLSQALQMPFYAVAKIRGCVTEDLNTWMRSRKRASHGKSGLIPSAWVGKKYVVVLAKSLSELEDLLRDNNLLIK